MRKTIILVACAIAGLATMTSTGVALQSDAAARAADITMTSPADGSTVAGTSVPVAVDVGTATDIAGVQFRVDGVKLGPELTLPPFAVTLDSTKLTNQPHYTRALVRYTNGVRAYSNGVLFSVNNPALPPGTPLRLAVVGPPEPVYTHDSEACYDRDYGDRPLHAYRIGDAQVEAMSSSSAGVPAPTPNAPNRQHNTTPFYGPDLDHLVTNPGVRCKTRPAFESEYNWNPAAYDDRSWLSGGYTEDGKTVYMLVHEEYHGENVCSKDDQATNCLYSAVTMAVSTDGGRTFAQPTPPSQLVASAPYTFDQFLQLYQRDGHPEGPIGYGNPSNIIKKDGYYYSLLMTMKLPQAQGAATCLIRTSDLSDPSSWRAWNGFNANGAPVFVRKLVNPYRYHFTSTDTPEDHMCKPIAYDEIGSMHDSLSYNTFLRKYVLIGTTGAHGGDDPIDAVYYSLSDDLVHWTPRRQLPLPNPTLHDYVAGDCTNPVDPINYPSLVDPESPTRNFDTTGERPYLYATLFHFSNKSRCGIVGIGMSRDLVRFPLRAIVSR